MNRVVIALPAAAAALALTWSGAPNSTASVLGANAPAWAATAIPQATLKIAGKGFGVSTLSSDGRTAVVAGSRGVYLFRVSSEASWTSIPKPAAKLRLPGSALANLTAVASSSDGTTVLVAAGAVGNSQAAVYVFHAASPHAWKSLVSPQAKLTNAADPTGFGAGVALSSDGTTALVGDLGGADIFHVATAGSWQNSSTPTALLVADAVGAQRGGMSIAVALSADGTTALIGTTSLPTFVGAAYMFRAAAPDAWVSSTTPDAVLTDGLVGLFGDGFGQAVALSPDGVTALVGAPNFAIGPAGAAYFFTVGSPEAWTSTAEPNAVVDRVSAQDGSGEVPGWSVALSERGTALVGEPSLRGGSGNADVLHVVGPDESWGFGKISHARLTNAAGPPRDLFGAAVGLSADGTTALVSSVRATLIFTEAGSRNATHCYVPYLAGEAMYAARRAIASTHCRVGKVSRIRASRARGNRVISQTPGPGKRLTKGATVDLRVG